MKLGVFVSDFKYDAQTLDKLQADEVGVFLVQDGVYNAVLKENGSPSKILDKGRVCALKDDVKFRGFSEDQIDDKVKPVSYDDIVDMMVNDFDQLVWL